MSTFNNSTAIAADAPGSVSSIADNIKSFAAGGDFVQKSKEALQDLTKILNKNQRSEYSTTIAIDSERSVIHFYSITGTDRSTIVHNIKSFAGGPLNENFFNRFKDVVKEYATNNPSDGVRKVTVVLPDSAIITDTVRVPTMRGFGQTQKALETVLSGLYRNYSELYVIAQIAEQNKQYTTFSVAAVQKNIISNIYAACSENRLHADTLTYSAGAAVGGALLINPKLKNASYLFLDIKDVYSRFVFVANGRTVGSYSLPFGLEFLKKNKITQEDMLFDHSYAELTVINAKEKARSKKLTVMAAETEDELDEDTDIDEELDETSEDSEQVVSDETVEQTGETAAETEAAVESEIAAAAEVTPQINRKIFTKKARKLPKFMQREIPDTREGILYENFRVFVKWALTLIQENDKLVELGKPEFVCVNLPRHFIDVLDTVNAESEENGVTFVALSSSSEDASVLPNLELYGGLFPRNISSMGKF